MTTPASSDEVVPESVRTSSSVVHLGPVGEALIVARYELIAMLLSVRSVLFAVIYGGLSFGVGALHGKVTGWMDEKLAEQMPSLSAVERADMLNNKEQLGQMFEKAPELVDALGGQAVVDALVDGTVPSVVLLVLFVSTFTVPGLVLIVGYDRIADDLATRYARFILQRIRRGSYLAGKILGHWGAVLIVMMVVHLLLVALSTVSDGLDPGAIAVALPRVWLGLAVFLLAYVGFSAMLSSTISPPFAALAVGGMMLMGLWLASFVDAFGVVWMGTWDMRLWVLDPPALGVFVGYSTLFIGLAFARLRTRDV